MIKQVKESELEKYLSPEGMAKHRRSKKTGKVRQAKPRRQGVFYPL